jgi:hypothetical protein
MQAYEAAYRYFRDVLFVPLGETLPDLILTFSRTRGKQQAFFVPESWSGENDDASVRRCELAIVPTHTAAPARELMASLVHEMAHYADFLAGTAPKSSGYHGKKWAERMERLGLPEERRSEKSRISVSHTISSGGPYDRAFAAMPAAMLLPFVALDGAPEPEADTSVPIADGATKKPSKHGKRAKYACGRCATTMRGPSGRRVICGDCEMPYVEEQSEDKASAQ